MEFQVELTELIDCPFFVFSGGFLAPCNYFFLFLGFALFGNKFLIIQKKKITSHHGQTRLE